MSSLEVHMSLRVLSRNIVASLVCAAALLHASLVPGAEAYHTASCYINRISVTN